ncbi:MAG: hypothetical protein NVS2B12_06310 [Ktedonobacteraceae bacterium]
MQNEERVLYPDARRKKGQIVSLNIAFRSMRPYNGLVIIGQCALEAYNVDADIYGGNIKK